MSDTATQVEIPARALFKAAEVCEILNVQPYVLRSWEAEFPELGVAKTAGGPRTYRRKDVEQVARIRHLLLVEGLTLAGARRRLEEETAPIGPDAAEAMEELIGQNARERLTAVKLGLRSILELLGAEAPFRSAPPAAPAARLRTVAAARTKAARRKPASPARHGSTRASNARRKRSA
jgi:DNA-binding transcriptional MerR regulator